MQNESQRGRYQSRNHSEHKNAIPPEITDEGIRLISDLDIGSLKLLAAANRGEQKDFYDLFLLTEKHGLEKI